MKKKKTERLNCPNCGKKFVKKRSTQKFCCVRCGYDYSNKSRYPEKKNAKCLSCGKVFLQKYGNHKFCSLVCGEKNVNVRRNRGIIGSVAKCLVCKQDYKVNAAAQKYCTSCSSKVKGGKVKIAATTQLRDNEVDKNNIKEWLKSEPLSVGELSRRLDRSRDTVIKLCDELTNEGYDINLNKEQQQMVLEKEPRRDIEPLKLEPMYRNYTKIGLVSDTQLGSKYQQLTLLKTAYKIGEQEKLDFMVHSGDLVDGESVYRGQVYETFVHGADEQAEYTINNYPYTKKFKTYIVAGNHDLSFKIKAGHNIVRRICKERDDLVYRGDLGARFNVKKLRFEVIHPKGGQSYARSYKPQKIIEASTGNFITKIRSTGLVREEIPQFFVSGHLHINFWMTYRGVQAYLVPCFQSQTPFLKSLGLFPEIGMFIINAYFDKEGNVTKLVHDYRDFTAYVKDNDW